MAKCAMDSIQRCINTIRDGHPKAAQAESALRNLCTTIIAERDSSWLNLADELLCTRFGDMATAGDNRESALYRMKCIEHTRTNVDLWRSTLLEIASHLDSYNICFLAAGFGKIEDMFRSKEQGNVVEAKQQVALFMP